MGGCERVSVQNSAGKLFCDRMQNYIVSLSEFCGAGENFLRLTLRYLLKNPIIFPHFFCSFGSGKAELLCCLPIGRTARRGKEQPLFAAETAVRVSAFLHRSLLRITPVSGSPSRKNRNAPLEPKSCSLPVVFFFSRSSPKGGRRMARHIIPPPRPPNCCTLWQNSRRRRRK